MEASPKINLRTSCLLPLDLEELVLWISEAEPAEALLCLSTLCFLSSSVLCSWMGHCSSSLSSGTSLHSGPSKTKW